MGMVFGVQNIEEPAYKVVLDRTSNISSEGTPYELRSYSPRFAIEAEFEDSSMSGDNRNSPFMKLAGYIGVMSAPQNEGSEAIAMTAPVSIERKEKQGEKIAMTAPVSIDSSSNTKKMQFFLPAKYDSLDKIPTPTDPAVSIREVPSAVGAVHRFSGSYSEDYGREVATQLVEQLQNDGLGEGLDKEKAMRGYQYWGYNPPWTLPWYRRNEIWVELSDDQVEVLRRKHGHVGEQ